MHKNEFLSKSKSPIFLISLLLEHAIKDIKIYGDFDLWNNIGLNIGKLAKINDRVKKRWIYPTQNGKIGGNIIEPICISNISSLKNNLFSLLELNWKIRMNSSGDYNQGYLIVDDYELITLNWLKYPQKTSFSNSSRFRKCPFLAQYLKEFKAYWKIGKEPNNDDGLLKSELLYKDKLINAPEENRKQIINISSLFWDRLISEIKKEPAKLRQLPPRRFEELIANIFIAEGFEVYLTPPTKDKGRDVIVYQESSTGRHMYLIECKRYSEDNPVSVGVVRSLYGVVMHEKATAGVIVTTSYFTKEALQFKNSVRYQLELRDYNYLIKWLNKVFHKK